MAHGDQDNETPASPFSSTRFQLSALFLLIVLIAGIAIALFHGGNGPAKSQKQVIVSANTSTTSSTGPCSLPAGSQQVPSNSPRGRQVNCVGGLCVV